MTDLPVSTASMDFPPPTLGMEFSQPMLPIPLDEDVSDFDYTTFFQGDEPTYFGEMAEDSSASTSTNVLPSENSPLQSLSPQPSGSVVRSNAHTRQRLERRGHTKSRRGCYNCKRRRIKCQETKPSCGHCLKTGLRCEYPTLPVTLHQPLQQIPLFSMQDMRFFQHFLVRCYPHQQTGSEYVWLHEIPRLCEKYDYLMHAILGFAASELLEQDASLVTSAVQHRLKAVRAIRKTLTEVPKANTFEEGNALMATCFVLTFQSLHLDDGMIEYMTFIRGITIVAIRMHHKGARFLFGDFLGDKQNKALEPYMQNLPLIEQRWVNSAFAAIQALGPLCQLSVESTYHQMILDMVQQLYVSSWGAYKAMTKHYSWWMTLPHAQFRHLVDPNNQVCILLATHWIALKQIMASITDTEAAIRAERLEQPEGQSVKLGLTRWLKYLNRLVDVDYVAYNQWPLWVEARMDRNRGYFGRTTKQIG